MEKGNYNLVMGFIVLTLIILVVAIAGWIESFAVKLGDTVHEGDTLVYIDSPEIRAKIAQATVAQARAAKSQYDMEVNGARREDREGEFGVGGYCSGEERSICLYICLSHYTS